MAIVTDLSETDISKILAGFEKRLKTSARPILQTQELKKKLEMKQYSNYI